MVFIADNNQVCEILDDGINTVIMNGIRMPLPASILMPYLTVRHDLGLVIHSNRVVLPSRNISLQFANTIAGLPVGHVSCCCNN
jgi:hypothetical protein